MMYRSIFFVICMIILSTQIVSAQRHIGYCDDVQTTADIQQCVHDHHKAVQDELKQIYELSLNTFEKDQRAGAEAAQKAWLSYRDAQCGWEETLADNTALTQSYKLSCLAYLTEQRKKLLENLTRIKLENEQFEAGLYDRWMNVLSENYPDVIWDYKTWQRADLNCSGKNQEIIKGLSISEIAPAAIVEEDVISEGADVNTEEGTDIDVNISAEIKPYGVQLTIAIIDNLALGKPRTDLIRIPVKRSVNSAQNDHSLLCSSNINIDVVDYIQYTENANDMSNQDVPLDSVVDPDLVDVSKAPEIISNEADQTCRAALRVSDGECAPLIIHRTEGGYEIAPYAMINDNSVEE